MRAHLLKRYVTCPEVRRVKVTLTFESGECMWMVCDLGKNEIVLVAKGNDLPGVCIQYDPHGNSMEVCDLFYHTDPSGTRVDRPDRKWGAIVLNMVDTMAALLKVETVCLEDLSSLPKSNISLSGMLHVIRGYNYYEARGYVPEQPKFQEIRKCRKRPFSLLRTSVCEVERAQNARNHMREHSAHATHYWDDRGRKMPYRHSQEFNLENLIDLITLRQGGECTTPTRRKSPRLKAGSKTKPDTHVHGRWSDDADGCMEHLETVVVCRRKTKAFVGIIHFARDMTIVKITKAKLRKMIHEYQTTPRNLKQGNLPDVSEYRDWIRAGRTPITALKSLMGNKQYDQSNRLITYIEDALGTKDYRYRLKTKRFKHLNDGSTLSSTLMLDDNVPYVKNDAHSPTL